MHADLLHVEAELDEVAAALLRGVIGDRVRIGGPALRHSLSHGIGEKHACDQILAELLRCQKIARSRLKPPRSSLVSVAAGSPAPAGGKEMAVIGIGNSRDGEKSVS